MTIATSVTLLSLLPVATDGASWQSASVRGGKDTDRRRWLGAVVRPAPLNLAIATVLLLLPWVVALLHSRHLDNGAVGLGATFSLGLPALWLGLAGYWVAQREADKSVAPNLRKLADGLAGRLGSQWAGEAEARRLNDPYPLPVSWMVADASLAGDLDVLKKLATTGAGWSASTREKWAREPGDLAGGGDKKLADVLAAVPTGRLVILGEPGSGKTMLMVGLVLDLLAQRRRGGPIPVLASLASWDPDSQDLHGWLEDTLTTDYPDLAATRPGPSGDTCFQALLAAGLILPILDGLDEIPEPARPIAITRINEELKPGEPMVATCRTEDYRAAVSPRNSPGAVLRAAAVQLEPLEFDEVASYLHKDAGPDVEGRWDFLDTLNSRSPVRQALATPLMVGLARVIYNPRVNERVSDLRHPAELCELADRSAVEGHLFDAFIPAAYRSPSGGRWTAQQAEKWLVFLARHLEYTTGSPDLAWWQLREAISTNALRLAVGLATGAAGGLGVGLAAGFAAGPASGLLAGFVAGLVFGLAGFVRGWVPGLVVGLVAGLAYVLADGLSGLLAGLFVGVLGWLAFGLAGVLIGRVRIAKVPTRGVRIERIELLIAGLVLGFAVGASSAEGHGPMSLLIGGLLGGSGGVLIGGLAGGFAGVPRNLVEGFSGVRGDLIGATNPRAVLERDRRVALFLTLISGVLGGLVFGPVVGVVFGLKDGLLTGLVTAEVAGLVAGRRLGMNQTAWPSYILTKWWLVLHHHVPWPFMDFLADAHRRGTLRQAGAVYQFRHIELQHRLANRAKIINATVRESEGRIRCRLGRPVQRRRAGRRAGSHRARPVVPPR